LETLQAVKVSKPSILPSSTPAIRAHGTLYDWIDNAKKSEGTSCLSAFGKIVGGILPNNMRNGLLTVLFSEKQKIAFELDQHGLNQFYHWLIKNPRASSPEQLARIAKLMVEVDSRVKMEKNVKPSVVKGKKKGFKM
jgi:hypothetical protein